MMNWKKVQDTREYYMPSLNIRFQSFEVSRWPSVKVSASGPEVSRFETLFLGICGPDNDHGDGFHEIRRHGRSVLPLVWYRTL
ncbi:hypothetical protein AVEN_229410-1 [Araneus ventricosus]|uniref:Uncharacterized protein n=1 Tax=Araneus ventricosus TaxID=182803 RepID=A0A4Y2MIX3_ARAVE|nr:hypothetical protein AVEN_229410-1 [Araneus ventricosus]